MKLLPWVAVFALSATGAVAQGQYPEKQITVVVPFTAGGSTDIVAREIAKGLEGLWKRSVIVENRPGAGTSIGLAHIAKSAPDGYTIAITSSAFTINPVIQKNIPFNAEKDFTPLAMIGRVPMMVVASENAPAKTMAEMVKYIHANPGKISYASAGIGTTTHMSMELLAGRADLKMEHVPYAGGNEVMTSLYGGHTQYYAGSTTQVIGAIRTGKLVGIGIMAPKPSPQLPNVPAWASMYPGLEAYQWWGAFAPANLPPDVAKKLNEAINGIASGERVKSFLEREAAEATPLSLEQFAKVIKTELVAWDKVAADRGLKPK